MGNEMEKTVVKEECLCKSKGFRKFLVVTLGTFVGVFCALSLFCALHKPPMPMMMPNGYNGMPPYMMMHHHHMRNCDCPCHKKMMKDMKNQAEKFKKDVKDND